ncbi:type III-B CRISPR module-associated protein Cmr3 [Clostridium botulinum]|uniref:CRISPR-associated protein Cmr3 n=1 Tax=Clostridium botulinum TaxID=1491 RepID=A0A6G4HHY4_CLOBO|nr:type III-B CRISPR module-associated protein Cmr3 [Clostridium botulinum]MBY6839702.1 CRISPR-associated protein Cmr3 [Clostridium botulinum]NFH34599.1 CRISPR-associated protein Cmr3 [Clostridium botulinum]NFU26686.1 CRISPR-associated protein Cmr3 [Clostridium botulinum]NFV04856.1 CRISPR-associated protein Cmr3 [Clostridium botulinum]
MKLLKIKPYDNTFFRLGNNFEFKISNVIQTKNVAYPSTFFGAIFTAILTNNDKFRNKFLSINKNTDHLEILNIKQVYLYDEKQDMVYIKAPKDIFANNKEVKFGKFKEIKGWESCISYPYYLEEPEGSDLERADYYFISIIEFYDKYKNKVLYNSDLKHEDEIFKKNTKTGISLDNSTGIIKESLLYTIEQTEFKNITENYHGSDWSFVVEYDINNDFLKKNHYPKIEDLDKGELKLGGETKVCTYEVIENSDINEFKSKMCEDVLKPGEKLKVILTSDSYFTESESFTKLFNDDMKFLALVNDKPIYIGGFDVKENKEKAMYKGYSAGTILLLLNKSGKDINIKKYLDMRLANKLENRFYKSINLNNGFNQYIYVKGE